MEESSKRRSGEFVNSGEPIQKSISFLRLLHWFDQSSRIKALLSWSVFFLLAVIVPMISHFVLICADCDFKHRRPYDALVQLSLSIFAGISFFSLSDWSKKYGIRKFLFFDKLKDVTEEVRRGYNDEIQRSMKLVALFVLPSLTLQATYRIWWYASGSSQIPYIINPTLSHVVACTLQLSSWLYRTSLFIIACILYQNICQLQTLRLGSFAGLFSPSETTDFTFILAEHLKIRREMKIVSHRFRRFLVLSLFFVTATQFMALLTTIRASVPFNIYEVGELALCSISLVSGLFICLKSATRMTNKAQSVTGIATQWNVYTGLDTFNNLDDEETPKFPTSRQHFQILSRRRNVTLSSSSDDDGEGEEDNDIDNTNIHPIYASAISFQKRQALVTYLENNRAGITVYGFLVDKTWLRMIFSIELALLLWLLKKTIVNIT